MLIDTLRADDLSSYGSEFEIPPNLDRLAALGVLFERVIAPSSWSRAALETADSNAS